MVWNHADGYCWACHKEEHLVSVYYVPVMICVATAPLEEAPTSSSFLQKRKEVGRRTSLAQGHSQQAAGSGFEPRQAAFRADLRHHFLCQDA